MSGNDLKEAAKDLPKNWEVFQSKKSSRLYYFNNATKKTQWQHPNLGVKNQKSDEKSKSMKRKALGDEQKKGKFEKTKQFLARKLVPVKIKNDSHLLKTGRPVGLFYQKRPSKDPTGKLTENAKTVPQIPKLAVTQTPKTIPQIPKLMQTIIQTPKTVPQIPKLMAIHQTTKANPQINKTAPQTPKTTPQTSEAFREQKRPTLVRSKSQNVIPSKKITKLQPLTRTKSIGEGSDSGVSDSSDRILAWLAGTSNINFKDHPVPTVVIKENPTSNTPLANLSERKAGKQKSEKQNIAILERLEASTGVSKAESDLILDKLLPKHSQTHTKQRYTPYKITLPNPKQNKPNSTGLVSGQTTAKTKILKASVKTSDGRPTANQNGLYPDLANSVARDFGGKPGENGFCRPEAGLHKARGITTGTTESLFIANLTSTRVQSENVQSNLTSVVKANNVQNASQKVVFNQVLHTSDVHEDEVIPMEEGVGSFAFIPLSQSEVADMDIDNAEEFAKEIVKELKEMRDSNNVHPSHIPKDPMAMKVSSDGYESTLYIVLDTNVLLSHLKFVVELKDFPIPGVGMPTLVIPWVVIQELDSLKENKWKRHESADGGKTMRVDMLARVAIKFLNGSFQKSDPRVRGQTANEAAEYIGNLQEETNDDRILQCCLLFHERAKNGNCVLFSNDINLCNKAMVNGIKAFTHEKLLPGLKDLFQCGVIVKQNWEEYNNQVAIEEDLARQRQKADDILCELQIILREGLSYIIESEMKVAYDDLWLEIVHIKPPWTLIDVLHLLHKHWIAVFGHILKRDRKAIIDKLRQKFDDRKGTASSLQFCSEILQLALQLFQSFAAHSNYDDAMPKCLAAVNVLVQKCQQFQGSVPTSSTNVQPKCLTYPMITSHERNNSSGGYDEVVSGNEPLHEEVMNTFNLIWTAVTQFSTQIFTALGYPNTISDGVPQDFPKASKEEAVSFLRVLCPKLINLVLSIQNVLRDPWEKASQNRNLFIQLEQAIALFLKEVLSQENNATAEKLFNFCQDASTRTSLVQGLSQLDRASGMLQHCASVVVQSNTMSHEG